MAAYGTEKTSPLLVVERFISRRNGRFERHEVLGPEGTVAAEAWPDVAVEVSSLFEGLSDD